MSFKFRGASVTERNEPFCLS